MTNNYFVFVYIKAIGVSDFIISLLIVKVLTPLFVTMKCFISFVMLLMITLISVIRLFYIVVQNENVLNLSFIG